LNQKLRVTPSNFSCRPLWFIILLGQPLYTHKMFLTPRKSFSECIKSPRHRVTPRIAYCHSLVRYGIRVAAIVALSWTSPSFRLFCTFCKNSVKILLSTEGPNSSSFNIYTCFFSLRIVEIVKAGFNI